MNNKFFQAGFILGNIALSLAVLPINPTQAAEFSFKFGNQSGRVSFEDSPSLTGIGRESLELDALTNSQLTYQISFSPSIPFAPEELILTQSDIVQGYNPTLEFNSGNLVGISLNNTLQNYITKRFEDQLLELDYFSFGGLSLQGNQYDYYISAESTYAYSLISVYDESGNIIDYRRGSEITDEEVLNPFRGSDSLVDSGTIEFETIVPIKAIPEPLTILGAMSVIGFAGMFKRQLAKPKNLSNRSKN